MEVNSRASASNVERDLARADEHAWIERAQSGDPRALDWLVRSQWERVERLLARILGPRQDLEDLVQSTFLETLRALPSYRGESALSTFVCGIAVHIARRAMRPGKVQRLSVGWGAEGETQARDERSLDARFQEAEALRRVRGILESVAEPKRIAFLLWALGGVDVDEIATIVGASVSATRSRIFHAQRELKERAAKDPYLTEWLKEAFP